MSQVEAIEDNRKDEQNTVFLTSQAALVISLLVASVIVFTAKSFTEMSEEEKVIAEQISDSSFKPKEFSHIASADIEIHCPSVKDKSATQVVCDISYFWVESNNSNKFKTQIPIGEYNYGFDITHETKELGFSISRNKNYHSVVNLDLDIDKYTEKSTAISDWIKNRISAAVTATAHKPEVIESSKKEEVALSYL